MNHFLNSKVTCLPVRAFATSTAQGTLRTELPLRDPQPIESSVNAGVQQPQKHKPSFFKRQIVSRFKDLSGGQLKNH